jgi:hypothetical protein
VSDFGRLSSRATYYNMPSWAVISGQNQRVIPLGNTFLIVLNPLQLALDLYHQESPNAALPASPDTLSASKLAISTR